jgi:hypothetical protein
VILGRFHGKLKGMARGWESKSVESQQESAAAARRAPSNRSDPQTRAQRQALGDLELARARVLQVLSAATNPRHREQLEAALRHLDQKIAELGAAEAN